MAHRVTERRRASSRCSVLLSHGEDENTKVIERRGAKRIPKMLRRSFKELVHAPNCTHPLLVLLRVEMDDDGPPRLTCLRPRTPDIAYRVLCNQQRRPQGDL